MNKIIGRTLIKRTIAIVAAFAITIGYSAMAIDTMRSAGTPLHVASMNVGSNAVFDNTVSWHNTNNREESFSISYKPDGDVVPMVVYGSTIWGTNKISTITKYLQDQGYTVVGGINADYFSAKTGVPMGLVIRDSVIRTSSDGRPAVFFKADGSAFISKPFMSMTLTNEGGGMVAEGAVSNQGKVVQVGHYNKFRMPYVTYLLSTEFSSETKTSTKGKEVMFKVLEGEVKTTGTVLLEVADVFESTGSVKIPEGHLMLTCDAISEKFGDLSGFSVGDKVTLRTSHDDPRIDEAVSAVGGGSPSTGNGILVENGVVAPNLGTGLHPRSAVGIKADGTVVLYVIDGRKNSYSNGLTEQDLAEELIRQGCVSALNLDGGGSSALNLRKAGDSEVTVMNTPSDGGLRSCSNYIMLVNKNKGNGVATNLHYYPYDPIVLTQSNVQFSTIKATDSGYNPVGVPDGIVHTGEEGLGTLDSATLRFQAGDKAMVGVMTATAGNGATGTTRIHLIDEVDTFDVMKKGTKPVITSMALQPNETFQFDMTATSRAQVVMCSPSAFQYQLAGDIGTISENGLFTATATAGAKGFLTISFGSLSKKIPVTVGSEKPMKIEDFEGETNLFTNTTSNASVTSKKEFVKLGDNSGVLGYDFANTVDGEINYFAVGTPFVFAQTPSTINMWVYGDNSANTLKVELTTQTGEKVLYGFDKTINFNGYTLLRATIGTVGASELTGFVIENTAKTGAKGNLYIDHIYAPGDVAADTEKPNIVVGVEGTNITATVSDNTSMDFKASDITIKVDGKKVAHGYEGGTATAVGDFSAFGMHRVTATVTDAFGNMASQGIALKTGEVASSFVDMGSHWSMAYVQFMSDKGVVKGVETKNGLAYNPEVHVTRGEFSTMVSRYLGLDEASFGEIKLPFLDNDKIPSWATNPVKAMYSKGYINGKTVDGGVIFDPNAPITRGEIFAILGKIVPKGYGNNVNLSFSDSGDVPSWALDGAKTMVYLGVVGGYDDGTLKPSKNVTRAEVGKILFYLY